MRVTQKLGGRSACGALCDDGPLLSRGGRMVPGEVFVFQKCFKDEPRNRKTEPFDDAYDAAKSAIYRRYCKRSGRAVDSVSKLCRVGTFAAFGDSGKRMVFDSNCDGESADVLLRNDGAVLRSDRKTDCNFEKICTVFRELGTQTH